MASIGLGGSLGVGGSVSGAIGGSVSVGGSVSIGASLGAAASIGLNVGLGALGLRMDPYLDFRFLVEIDGMIVAGFTDVTGLAAEIGTTPYKEGGCNAFEHHLPGPATFPPLVLKRGLTDFDNLWSWHEDVRNGRIQRRNGSILLGGEAITHGIWCWNFLGAYPVKWTGPELQAASATVAVESLELVHRGLTKGLFS
jgi:phage tail-like protein